MISIDVIMVSDFYTKECQLPVFDREETILLRRTKSHDQGGKL